MASTYVNDLRLNEMATGDASGTWGEVTNTNLELIAEAFSYGTEAITTNADTHTTTIADGATDPGRSLYLKYTGTLDSACTITIGPNTVSKMWFIENATTGSQNIIISQGSGANVTIPAGETKVVYSDGAGAGAAITDAFANLKVSDAAQTNITSVGALDGGSITSGFGSIDVGSSAITTTGTVTGNTLAGTLSTAAQPNITSLGTLTGLTTTGDINFGDNDKAIFGAGSDLEIFHNGTTSYIRDVGDGDLQIFATDDVYIRGYATNNYMARFNENGAVTLYHNNSDKLATTSTGIDVTGEIVGDGLDITDSASDIAFLRSSNATTSNVYITNTNATTGNTANLYLAPANNIGGSQISSIAIEDFSVSANRTADLAFSTRLNGTMSERLRIDSTGNVGIGTASPNSTAGFTTVTLNNATSGGIIDFENNTSLVGRIYNTSTNFHVYNQTANSLLFGTGGSEKMRIDSSGNVGIGVSSPQSKLDVEGGNNVFDIARFGSSTSDNSEVTLGYFDSNATNGIPSLIGSSDFGGLIQGGENGHLVLGIRDNDATDAVDIISGGGNFMTDSTYDTLVATFRADGNVGINTSSPDGNLEVVTSTVVSGASDTVNNVLIGLQSANRPTIILDTADTTYTNRTWNITNVGSAGSLAIGRNGLDVMTLKNEGSVGIGTSSPSSKLETVGGDGITISNSGDTFLQLKTTGTTATNYIEFKDSGGSAGSISYNHTDNYLASKVNGAERMRIDSSGTMILQADGAANLGRIQFSSQASTYQILGGNNIGYMGYKTGGYHRFFGSDGAEDMRIDSSGNVLINKTSHDGAGKLEISHGSSELGLYTLGGYNYQAKFESSDAEAAIIIQDSNSTNNGNRIGVISNDMTFITADSERMRIDSSGNVGIKNNFPSDYNAAASDLVVGSGSGDAGMTIVGSTVGNGSIAFADGGTGATHTRGLITYDHSNDHMHFNTAGAERMRINSAGQVSIGTTSGLANLTIGGDSNSARVLPATDNVGYIGESSHRWQAIYAVTGSIQTSDEREKTEIKETTLGLDFIKDLKPVSYKWIDGKQQNKGKDEREHQGLIAQQVAETVEKHGIDKNNFGGLDIQKTEKYDDFHGMSYDQFVAPLIKAIQEQQAQIEALQSEINELKNS